MSAWEVETGVSRLKIHLQLRIEFEVTRGYMRACLQTEGESMESSPRQSHCGNQLPEPLPSPPGKRFASTGKPPASHLPLSLTQGFSFFLCRRFLMAVHMARVPPRSLPGATVVQPDCPHRPPATLRLAGHPQTHLRVGSPPPPLLHSMLPWLCHYSLCLLYGTGVSLPKPPTGAVCFTLLPSHTGHQGSWTCALCPRSFWAPSPPAHHPATPCTSHTVPLSTVTAGFLVTNRILTRGGRWCIRWTERPPVIYVSLGTHCQMRPSLQRLLPWVLPIIQHCYLPYSILGDLW